MAKTKDLWSQAGYLTVTESGTTTLTFAGLTVFSNILTPKGLILHSVEYNVPDTTIALLLAQPDAVIFGIAGNNDIAAIVLDDASVYDYNRLTVKGFGTPANMNLYRFPIVRDFSELPSGGKLVPADRIYAYVVGVSTATACTIEVRFNFTLKDLSAQEYLELAQALRVLK